MSTDAKVYQHNLFELISEASVGEKSRRAVLQEIITKTDELALVVRDYERLKPQQSYYEAIVKQYRGITAFRSRNIKFDVLEARQICKFLKGAKSRSDVLKVQIDELSISIGIR